jgi:hypothetical protein
VGPEGKSGGGTGGFLAFRWLCEEAALAGLGIAGHRTAAHRTTIPAAFLNFHPVLMTTPPSNPASRDTAKMPLPEF